MKKRSRLTIALVVAILLASLVGEFSMAQAAPTASGNRTNAKYVALGDSYSAGEGVEPFFKGTDYENKKKGQGCHRSVNGYPALIEGTLSGSKVSARYEQAGGSDAFAFVACSGAVIDDLSKPGAGNQVHDTPIDAAQISYVGEGTEYITITLGGNDVGFGKLLESCLVAAKSKNATEVSAFSLASVQRNSGPPQSQKPAKCENKIASLTSQKFPTLRDRLARTYSDILQKAPNA